MVGRILGRGVVVPLMYLSPFHRETGSYPAGRRRAGLAAAGLAAFGAVLALLLSSCSTSVTYAGDSSQDVYYKLPHSWTVYDQTALQDMGLVTSSTANSQAQASGSSYQLHVGFASADGHLSAHRMPILTGRYPWAWNIVESLGSSDQESLALGSVL